MYWDNTFLLLIPPMLLAFYAQSKVSTTFKKYTRVANARGYTGAEVAKSILQSAGIMNVKVERVKGRLSDHYDPRNKVLRLSESVYGATSVAAVSVAAHECGHAIQDAKGYSFLRMRHALFPLVNFGSNLAIPLMFLGFFLDLVGLIQVGILLFSLVVLFQIVTLPVEFNASSRALKLLQQNQYLTANEIKPAKKVLDAAALTYVAAAIVAMANLLRFALLFLGGRDD